MVQKPAKIAVITTAFLENYIRDAFTQMQLGCEYELYLYHRLEDVPRLFRQIPEDFAGVLTSGSFPAQVIRNTFPNTQKTIMSFNTDDAALCQLIIRLLTENRHLNFSRIYADLVEMFGMDLQSYLTHDFSIPLSMTTKRLVRNKTPEELFRIESVQYEKHLELWQKGQVDVCITRFSSLVEPLKKAGVRVYFPYPSLGYLKKICQNLLREIDYRKMQENAPSIIQIALGSPHANTATQEYHLLTIQTALMEFFGADAHDYFLRQSENGFEIMTSRKLLERITEEFRVCGIRSHLRQTISTPFYIGYGLGPNLPSARTNARHALDAAMTQELDCSYVRKDTGMIIGPLAIHETKRTTTNPSKPQIAPGKVEEVLSIIRTAPGLQITSKELAECLQITKRSANRILTAMEEDQILKMAGTRSHFSKGRPERIFTIADKQK